MPQLASVISEASTIVWTAFLPERKEEFSQCFSLSTALFLGCPFQNTKKEGQGKPRGLDSNGQEVVVNTRLNTFPAVHWCKGQKSHIE